MSGPVLRDIHVPSAPWWPLATGWWLLLALLVLVALAVAWWIGRRGRRGPLMAALREIDAIEARYAEDGHPGRLADAASRLMRRVARRVESDVASQAGEAWRAFVHRYARDASTRDVLDALIDARFRASPEIDADDVLHALRQWCRGALARRSVRGVRAPHVAVPT
ncbi:MAG TPA: DUF4381 domain-containing protein [Rhodanobacteraceae bacterium]